jgi:putative flippase GtrA
MAEASTARRRWTLPNLENISFFLVFLGLPLAVYVIFVISPFVQAFYYSLTDWSGFSKSMNFVGLTNYFTLTQDPVFTKAVLNSIVLVVILPPLVIVLSLALATLVTWRLNRALTFDRSGRRQHREALRYGIVTAAAQGTSYAVFAMLMLTFLAGQPQAAIIAGAACGALISYNGHRLFAFAPARPNDNPEIGSGVRS